MRYLLSIYVDESTFASATPEDRAGMSAAYAELTEQLDAAGVLRGGDGVWSALVAIAIVVVNLLLASRMLSAAARISPNALMIAALGGFLVRMGLVTAVVFAVRHQPWVDLPTLAVAILVTHLALLFWEMKYVSASLAFPTLKPKEAPSQ